jgi:hypothetical protein
MKRIIYAVAASLAFASASVYAQAQGQWPQPSFNDDAPVQYSATPSPTSRTPIARQDLPQPSFNDNAPVPQESASQLAADQRFPLASAGGSIRPGAVVGDPGNPASLHGAWPQPSFPY